MASRRRYFLDRRRVAPLILAAAAALHFGTGSTWAAWSADTSNPSNSFQSAPDWVAPTVTASVVVGNSGAAVGRIRPGGTYRVYANAADDGAPASGVAAVTANVSTLTANESSLALIGGTYPVGDATYGWQSAEKTADPGLTDSSTGYTYTHRATDNAGNARDQTGFPVVVDAVAPNATDVQAVNALGTEAVPDAGDVLTYSFSEAMNPASVLGGWNGTATGVTVRISRAGGTTTLTVRSSTAQLPLGSTVVFNYVANGATADFPSSTMTMSGSTIQITLGSATGAAVSAGNKTTMAWTPTTELTDLVGNPCSATAVNETGASDVDF